MDTRIKNIVSECSKGSDDATLSFPQVVGKLMEVGIERYSVDLVRHEKIFYLPDGDSVSLKATPVAKEPAQDFSASGVQSAIRQSQAGKITYLEFCELVKEAGCTFYMVSLKGRRAVYSGRSGENHVELFPRT